MSNSQDWTCLPMFAKVEIPVLVRFLLCKLVSAKPSRPNFRLPCRRRSSRRLATGGIFTSVSGCLLCILCFLFDSPGEQ